MIDPIPHDVLEATVQCFGRAFHYKDNVTAFFASCGVSRAVASKHSGEAKFVWARRLLIELGETEEGRVTQRRIVTDLCRLRKLPDDGVKDREGGLSSLRRLKELAMQLRIYTEEKRQEETTRAGVLREKQQLIQERTSRLEKLRDSFNQGLVSPNRQKSGYSLEQILSDLFGIFEIEYTNSYREPTQQIDGFFRFQGFDYLVEAKWRKDMPNEQEIGGFRQKVETKLESTRGLFVSIAGYRPEVVKQFSGRGCNIIMLDGSHLVHVLEGRIALPELLTAVIMRAAQRGMAYTAVGEI